MRIKSEMLVKYPVQNIIKMKKINQRSIAPVYAMSQYAVMPNVCAMSQFNAVSPYFIPYLNYEKTETDGFIIEQSSIKTTLETKITEITTKQNEISQLTTDKQDATNLITQKTSSKTTVETNLTNAQTQLQDVNDDLLLGETQELLDQKEALLTQNR
jgi:hypothetical protein